MLFGLASARRHWLRILLLLLLCYYLFPHLVPSLSSVAQRVRQTHPWSFQHEINAAFTPTQAEQACLAGLDPEGKDSALSKKPPIPNIAHFIFGLRNPAEHRGAGKFDFLCYLAVRAAVVALRADEVRLHYTYLSEPPSADAGADPLSNPWIRRLQPHIKLVHHPPEEFARDGAGAQGQNQQHWQAAHASDVLRLQILAEHGGIYLDIDAFALRPFGDLLKGHRDLVLGHEGGNRWGLCNAIMAARPGSAFVRAWLDTYRDADLAREKWNYRSVLLPKEMASSSSWKPASSSQKAGSEQLSLNLEQEVCTLPPDAFFWPTWTWDHIDWMHRPLSLAQADALHSDMAANNGGSSSNNKNAGGGAMFPGQLAYHAWNQMAYDRYLRHLTPARMRAQDTVFNILMRHFIEDDVV